MAKTRAAGLSGCNVFFDFDNTITPFDLLDDIIRKFSIGRDWVALEDAWRRGEIGSRECLEGQLRSVRATRQEISRYLDNVRLDGHFQDLLGLLRSKCIGTVILSDSFSFFIERILHNNGVRGVKLYSNRIGFKDDRIIPVFPYTNRSCPVCAHCKKMHISDAGGDGGFNIYIGDGLSDICPAEHSDVVFAKGSLLDHFTRTKRECIPFKDLSDIYRWFQEVGDVYETEAEEESVALKNK